MSFTVSSNKDVRSLSFLFIPFKHFWSKDGDHCLIVLDQPFRNWLIIMLLGIQTAVALHLKWRLTLGQCCVFYLVKFFYPNLMGWVEVTFTSGKWLAPIILSIDHHFKISSFPPYLLLFEMLKSFESELWIERWRAIKGHDCVFFNWCKN